MINWRELLDLLKYSQNPEEIDSKRGEIAEWIPIVSRMFEYDQNNSYHQYDLWMHSIHTVLGLDKNIDDDMLFLAALLHDIGKPDCRCKGKKEDDLDSHYYGHPERSEEIVRDEVVPTLIEKGVSLSEDDIYRLLYYVKHHDDRVSLRIKYFLFQ